MNKLIIALAFGVTGCASNAKNIQPAYISPLQYDTYSCAQLREEAARIGGEAVRVAGVQDSNATKDAVFTTVGIIIAWPVLFALKGDGQTASELARLKGQLDAIEQAGIRKNCGIAVQKPQ